MSLMLNVERLRLALTEAGYSSREAQDVLDDAMDDIDSEALEIITSASNDAIDYAIDHDAEAFIDDMQILPGADGIFRITTHSGITDYSRPQQEILPALLAGGKTGKDGHKYHVIPMQESNGSKTENSMFSQMQSRKDSIDSSREALRRKGNGKTRLLLETVQAGLAAQTQAAKQVHKDMMNTGGPVNFRTASDKQDSKSSWVRPEIEADMTDFIQELNTRILESMESSINAIMDSYFRQLENG